MDGILDLSVIIPCADDLRIARCLDSIDESVEVIVALNGATEDIRQIVARYSQLSILEIYERNLGKACDLAIHASKSSSVVLMNSDCVFGKGTIRKLSEILSKTLLVKCDVVFQHSNWTSRIIADSRDFGYKRPDKAYQPGVGFRKEIIEKIGYYFNHEVKWAEDADFSRRVVLAGIPIIADYSVKIYHPPVSVITDLKSAFRTGEGRCRSELLKLAGIEANYRFTPAGAWKFFRRVKSKKSFAVAAYLATLWSLAFYSGYRATLKSKTTNSQDDL